MRIPLLLIATVLYFLFAHWFYTQKISNICCGDETSTVAGISDSENDESTATLPEIDEEEPTEIDNLSAADVGPLTFNWSNDVPTVSSGFENYKTSIFRDFDKDNMLEITGYYYADETTPDGFDNMGFARANQIKKLFEAEIPGKIITNSKLISDDEGMEFNPFEAAEFNWIPLTTPGQTTIAEIDDRILLFFPFNSPFKEENAEVDARLNQLADYLNANSDRVQIIGHTDSTGDPNYNYDLGLQRAIRIRKILIGKGVSRNRIAVDSKGEMQPIATNRTPEGEHQNRRVVIQLLPEK